MLTLVMFASIAAAAPALPSHPETSTNQARRVIEEQLSVQPRTGPTAGLSAEEAEIVARRNLEQIGKLLTVDRTKVQ